jgi:predicted dehydrogenase
MLTTAIIGCGGIAAVHAQVLQALDNAALIAYADSVPAKAQDFAGRFGGNAYASLEELLAHEQPDVLHICTPHYLHTPMAIQARGKGIHVFLEKPPATTRTDLAALERAFAGSKTQLGICFQNRTIGSVTRVKELLDSEVYGKPLGARAFVTWSRGASYYTDSGWRGSWETEGGGVLVNQSIHTLDLLCYLLGKPVAVEATCANHHLKGVIAVEDTVEAYIDFGSAKALFYATTAFCTDSPILVEIVCEKGKIRLEGDTVTEYPATGEPILQTFKQTFLGKEYWGAGHHTAIAEFYRCVEEGQPYPIGLEAIKPTLELMMGVYESSLTRQSVALK